MGQGQADSASLKARGVLKKPPKSGIYVRSHQYYRPYDIHESKKFQACQPGGLVEVNTLYVKSLPGTVQKRMPFSITVIQVDGPVSFSPSSGWSLVSAADHTEE